MKHVKTIVMLAAMPLMTALAMAEEDYRKELEEHLYRPCTVHVLKTMFPDKADEDIHNMTDVLLANSTLETPVVNFGYSSFRADGSLERAEYPTIQLGKILRKGKHFVEQADPIYLPGTPKETRNRIMNKLERLAYYKTILTAYTCEENLGKKVLGSVPENIINELVE